MKVAILHQLPLEYYPPVTNALQYFSHRSDIYALAISCGNEKGRPAFHNERVQTQRFRFGRRSDSFLRRWKCSLSWHWHAAKAMKEFAPDVVLYYEPHSALAAFIYYRWFNGTARLFIHHHEYYAAEDYRKRGNRLTRLNHYFERQYLLPRADWVSQTNLDRLRFFQSDNPEVDARKCHVMPNLPPRNWMLSGSCRQESSTLTFRLVYVGSVSVHDTFIGPLVNWLLANTSSRVSLDIFAYNCDPATREFLHKSHGEIVRFHERGVDYEQLPDLLCQFDVGVILYRCHTVNYKYNASNKLFEYLMCGLDVWYPPAMLGVKPYARDDLWPRVVEVDFENLDRLDLGKLRSRDGLPNKPWTESCESQLAILEAEMRKRS
ncbi:MAG: hypothetical protein U0936_07265 [Planctomycetaceae bacterium]